MNKDYLSKLVKYGLYLLFFLLPWQTRFIWHQGRLNGGGWEYGTYSVYGTEILLWILVILNVIKKLSNKEIKKLDKDYKKLFGPRLHYYLITLLLLVASASVIWALDSELALFRLITLFESFLFFWLITSNGVSFKKMAWAIVFSAMVQAVLGLWQFLSQEIFASKWLGMAAHLPEELGASVVEVGPERWLRAYGSLPHPNILAGWLVMGLLMAVGLYECEWKKDRLSILKIFTLLNCYIVILFGLLMTFSRGAWITYFIILLIYYFINLLKRDRVGKIINYKLLIISLLVVGSFVLLFRVPFLARVTGHGRLETISNQERITGYKEAVDVVKENWLTGVGMGNYTLAVHDQIDATRSSWTYQPVHNLYFMVLAELGLIGLLFFLMIIGLVLRFIIYHLSFIIYFLPLLAVIILGLFDHYFWSLYFGVMIWWLVLGLSVRARD